MIKLNGNVEPGLEPALKAVKAAGGGIGAFASSFYTSPNPKGTTEFYKGQYNTQLAVDGVAKRFNVPGFVTIIPEHEGYTYNRNQFADLVQQLVSHFGAKRPIAIYSGNEPLNSSPVPYDAIRILGEELFSS